MFLLKHIFRLRESIHEHALKEAEMPFLDHLEDLRRTIIRMGITLLAAMVFCFCFSPVLMEVLRRPVESVRQEYAANHIPTNLTVEEWQQATRIVQLHPALTDTIPSELCPYISPKVRLAAETIRHTQIANLLPAHKRDEYLNQHCITGQQRDIVDAITRHPHLLQSHQTGNGFMSAFHPGEAFMLSLYIAFFSGMICAFPLLLYFALRFIMPGLLEHERSMLLKCLAGGSLLFIAGCGFAYFGLLPRVLAFFYTYSLELGIENDWRIGYYLVFAAKLVFVTGAIFELPVILMPLIKLHILHYDLMRRTRAYAIIACFAVALFLAPAPDPGTMFLLALPMYLLYECCILLALLEKKRYKTANQTN